MTATTTARTGPRTARLTRDEAVRLAGAEYGRFAAQLRRLDPADWARPTDCTAWDVRQMAAHVLGMAEMVATVRALVRQNALAARAGGGIDALTGLQVREREHLTPAEIVTRFTEVAPRAARGRRRLSRTIGRLPLPEKQVVGESRELWRFGFLVDVVLTRDTWMHRTDIALATGRRPELTAAHDGILVADVVREWAERHGRPYRLRLTGPAGGEWSSGTDGERLELDAVEFCRVLSGRGSGTGLLAQEVPF
ncbi:maleylpyruvate isomerase family mycothiol-dependent enzyme [Blastococcus sp. SYSU D01042]